MSDSKLGRYHDKVQEPKRLSLVLNGTLSNHREHFSGWRTANFAKSSSNSASGRIQGKS